jgi:beta-N-acetylhexosaminidase
MYLKTTIKINFLLLYLSIFVQFQNFSLAQTSSSVAIAPSSSAGTNSFARFTETSTESLLSKMTLEEKIGQLFIVGFPQDNLDAKLKEHILKNKIGSFILFKRNIPNFTDVKKLNTDLTLFSMEKLKTPPLLAVDQEGGNVTRIETKPRMPYFFHLGDINDPAIIYKFGNYTASLLTSLGFNFNLAPVLDLADPAQNSFISLRSFGKDPNKVSNMGYSYSKGLLDKGVIPTAKHFPGLGESINDPHIAVTTRNVSLADLEKMDLVPFKEFAKLGPSSAVMMSHMIYELADSSKKPASFSSFLINDLLRKRLNFTGVVLTDDLHMKASTQSMPPSKAALEALLAGADMVMLSWSLTEQRKTFELIKASVLSGKISLSSLDQKVSRILTLKKTVYAKPSDLLTTPGKITRSLASIDSNSLGQLQKNIFVSKVNSAFINSELITDKNVCVVSNASQVFKNFRQPSFQKFLGYKFPNKTNNSQFNNFFKTTPCEVFFITVESLDQVRLLNNLPPASHRKIVLFNYTIPSALKERRKFFNVIDLYGLGVNDIELLSARLRDFSLLISEKSKNSFSKN